MYLRRVLRDGTEGTDRRRDAVQERGGLPGPDTVLCHLSHPGAVTLPLHPPDAAWDEGRALRIKHD